MDPSFNALSLTHPTPMLSDSPLVSRLSCAAQNRARNGRAARNALYRRKKFLHSLPEDARNYYDENRYAEGLPRAFSIRFADPIVGEQDPELQKLDGQTIIFGQHGSNESGILFNGHRVQPKETSFVPATKSFSFTTALKSVAGIDRNDVGGYFSFESLKPTGFLAVGARGFNVKLDPKKVWYNVNVSANTGAYFSTGEQKIIWNPDSEDWKNASWECGGMTFGYGVTNIDSLQEQWVPECVFIDTCSPSDPPTQFELAASRFPEQYTCVMGPSTSKGSTMVIQVNNQPPEPPVARQNLPVKSLFPHHWEVRFSPFADQFNGVYRDWDDRVYAVSGTLNLEDDASLLSMLSVPRIDLPVKDLYAQSPLGDDSINVRSPTTAPTDSNAAVLRKAVSKTKDKKSVAVGTEPPPPPLKIFELLNLNPMVQDPNDPSGYRDSVAQLAMADFHDLIVYFMDPQLRTTFVQATVPDLPPHLLAIANDDISQMTNENKTFYQKLQVPFIVSMLSQGTMDHSDQCNGARANAQLKDIPTHDEACKRVYTRHSAKLYRARFIEKFPSINRYLKDQAENPRKTTMEKFRDSMKTKITAKSEIMKDQNKDYEKNLETALKDIDNLVDWAKERSLYWALELLYWVQNSALLNWFTQYTTGDSTATLSMNVKQLNALFGILENNAVNSKPKCRNFMQAFNEDMRLFQMTSVIPHLVDIEGNAQAFDNLVVQCLDEYMKNYKGSLDQNHIDAVKAAKLLYSEQELRSKLWLPLIDAQRLAAAVGAYSWQLMSKQWELKVYQSAWFKRLTNADKVFQTFQAAVACAIVVAGFLPDYRKQMAPEQKAVWGLCLAGICGFLVVKVAQGIVRFALLGQDITGFGNSLKCLLGFESVVDAIPGAALRLQNTFARFFTRTSKQTLTLAKFESWLRPTAIGEVMDISQFSVVERLLGRNMGEVIGTVAGIVLSVVAIVLAGIDIARNKGDDLLVAMDIIMLISSVIQILAVAAGWVMILGGLTTGFLATLASYSITSLCATWGGPLAIAFAVIGIIVFMVWFFCADHRDPIEKFLDTHVGPAGLRMKGEKQAPEYFNVVPAKGTDSSLVGLSIKGPLQGVIYGTDVKIDAKMQQVIAMDDTTKSTKPVEEVDYSLNTVWSLETQPDGKSLIYTASITKEKPDEDGFVLTTRTLWYLATSDDPENLKLELREMPGKEVKAERDAVMKHALWTIDIIGKPTVDRPDKKDEKGNIIEAGNILSAIANISQDGLQLGRWIDPKTGKPRDEFTVCHPDNGIMGESIFYARWEMSMAPIGPSEFTYAHPTWTLTVDDTDRRNIPRFVVSDASSGGLRWDIQPPLDRECFELVTEPGEDEGMIRQVEGKTPKLMAPTEYTVTCWLLYKGKAVGPRKTTVTIEVTASPL